MGIKIFLRTVFFLFILFVIVYTVMVNPQKMTFNFPLLLNKPVETEAPIIFFAIFAVGVFGGILLHLGGGSGKSGGDSKRK